ncbi:MAG: hypothetical protein DRQ58_10795 [Gammaproteobacteria bacterium]|nr:MAG: hypothetical protein DRQ58_10795 [Gammaproteobacteria bacterium]
MKYQLDSIDDLDESQKGLYEKIGDAYVLKIEGLDDLGLKIENVDGLKTAMQHERDQAKSAKSALQKLKKETEKKDAETAAKEAEASGDIEKIKENIRGVFQKDIETLDQIISKQSKKLSQLLIRDEANRLAHEIAVDTDAVEILAEHINNRLTIEEKDGDYVTVVIGDDGKPSGLSMKEYQSSLQTNKSLARLLKSSNGTGSGASNTRTGSSNSNPDIGGTRDQRVASIKAMRESA